MMANDDESDNYLQNGNVQQVWSECRQLHAEISVVKICPLLAINSVCIEIGC